VDSLKKSLHRNYLFGSPDNYLGTVILLHLPEDQHFGTDKIFRIQSQSRKPKPPFPEKNSGEIGLPVLSEIKVPCFPAFVQAQDPSPDHNPFPDIFPRLLMAHRCKGGLGIDPSLCNHRPGGSIQGIDGNHLAARRDQHRHRHPFFEEGFIDVMAFPQKNSKGPSINILFLTENQFNRVPGQFLQSAFRTFCEFFTFLGGIDTDKPDPLTSRNNKRVTVDHIVDFCLQLRPGQRRGAGRKKEYQTQDNPDGQPCSLWYHDSSLAFACDGTPNSRKERMMLIRRVAPVIFFLIFLLPGNAAALDPDVPSFSQGLPLGSYAPGFTLPNIEGSPLDLSDHLGRSPVVLGFWSIYCDSCVDEMLALQNLEDKYKGQGLVIIAVNEDIRVSTDRIRRFLERLEKYRGKVSYHLLVDQKSEVFNAFEISYLPTLVLIDADGRITSYHQGFDPGGEREFLRHIEKLVSGEETPAPPRVFPETRSETITVTGEAVLCGFYESGVWRKSFTGNDSLPQEMSISRDIARRDASRRAVVSALRRLNIDLFSHPHRARCIDESGIHLAPDPFETGDPVSNLMRKIIDQDFFQTVTEQEMLLDTTFHFTRTVRFFLDRFADELESLGYLREPLRINFTYVNMSPLDQKKFGKSLLRQSMFIGNYENPVFRPHSTSQVFEIYASTQTFADEISGMDFGDLQVYVEGVTPDSLELEVWK